MTQGRIVVAMSGGVDSSVAAYLLLQEGYEVIGISMRLWSYEQEATHGCCTPEDLYDARRVADQLGFPHYVANFEPTFESQVVEKFIKSYAIGETPNPCVRCNQDVKFQPLLRRARELGAKYLATGHYARREVSRGNYKLLRATDRSRDQSYFLFGMTQEELSQTVFPLGNLTKQEVRQVARDANLPIADKPDSQEICFVPNDYGSFVESRLPSHQVRPGNFVESDGNVLGQHHGIHQFTVGQRKGLGIASNRSKYVLSILPSGDVVVGSEKELYRSRFQVREPRWVNTPANEGEEYQVQIRSRFPAAAVKVEDIKDEVLTLQFQEPQRAITPGQAAVLYREDEVIGGGWIDSVEN